MPRSESATEHCLLTSPVIGIRAVDYQHAYFLDIYNDLVMQIQAAKGRGVVLSSFIAEVFSYTEYHFKTEESLMRAVDYPRLAEHRQEHRNFYERFDDLTCRLDEHRADLDELVVMIRDWITGHIDCHDRDFGVYYNAIKAGRATGRAP